LVIVGGGACSPPPPPDLLLVREGARRHGPVAVERGEHRELAERQTVVGALLAQPSRQAHDGQAQVVREIGGGGGARRHVRKPN